jgi:hypothetical protein
VTEGDLWAAMFPSGGSELRRMLDPCRQVSRLPS